MYGRTIRNMAFNCTEELEVVDRVAAFRLDTAARLKQSSNQDKSRKLGCGAVPSSVSLLLGTSKKVIAQQS